MVPTDQARDSTDFMISGSVTRWSQLFSSRDTGFLVSGLPEARSIRRRMDGLGYENAQWPTWQRGSFPGKRRIC